MVNARPPWWLRAWNRSIYLKPTLFDASPLAEQIFVRLKRGRHAKSVHGNTLFLLPLGVNAKATATPERPIAAFAALAGRVWVVA
jgi:hypothetical protein